MHAIQAQFLNVEVTDSHGHQPTFMPWFGALAHAIFFRKGTLDYFHTHICAPNAPNCGVLPGCAPSRISGSSTAPGKLTIGVLFPRPGTWRLFLQMKLGGADRDRPVHARRWRHERDRSPGWRPAESLRLVAVAAGVAAVVIVAILLLRSVLAADQGTE